MVENLAENLCQACTGEDSDLVEEHDHAGPSEQTEKDQVVSMLLSSDEEEQLLEEGLFKGHKKQYRTAGMVAKEWGEIPKAVQSRKKDTQHPIYLHTIRYSPRLDLSSVKPGAHFCRQTSTSWFSSHTTWKDSNGHRQSERFFFFFDQVG